MGAKCCKGKEKYPHLFSPIRIGNIRLKNRIIAAPTSPSMITTEGHFTPEMTAYLEEKAKGGVAVVTYGESIVHSATGKSHNKQLQLDSFGVKQGMAQTARAIHNAGAYANIQLSHGGKYGGLVSVGGDQDGCEVAYGPSHEMTPAGEVQEMPKELILEIVESYKTGAKLCKDCGFDMVQVHAAHGWLFSQFLSPVMNQRTDEFGGSLENRARFLMMALDAVREGVGPRFPIEIRISGDDLTDVGLGLEDCVKVAKMVEDKVDLFNVSCGNHEDPAMFCRTHPSAFFKRGVNVYLAAEIKKHVSIPVATIGGLNDPAQMEEIIASGKADIVYMARALLADPFLPRKVVENRENEIVKCLRCFTCMAERAATSTRRCTVNPLIGREIEGSEVYPAPVKKKVLVAGGGPGGLYAAYTAARRGHQVILCEKEAELGGILKSEQALPFKREMYELSNTYALFARNAGVEIRTSVEVTPEYVEKEAPDALIVAVGSQPLVPPIKGLDGDNVVIVNNYYLEKEKVTDQVVVFGGGLAGCECAIHLGQEGKQVHLVEMRTELAPDANVRHRPLLLKEIEKYVTVHTGCRGLEVRPDGVLCETEDKQQILVPGTSVICALGQRSRSTLADSLRDSAPFVRVIGDAHRVSTITNAVYEGYHAALDI